MSSNEFSCYRSTACWIVHNLTSLATVAVRRKAADIHEYDSDIDDHNVATWRAEAIEKKEITQMEELEELVEVR